MIPVLLALLWIGFLFPTVHWLDSADLTLSVASLGIGHPPGQPPYVLMSRPFLLLPVGDPAFRTAVASLAFCVLAIFGVQQGIPEESGTERRWIQFCVAAFALGALPRIQAVRPEVYALAAFLVVATILLSKKSEDRRFGYAGGLTFGLAMGVHPMIAAVAIPFLPLRRTPLLLVFAALAGCAYLYLPLRAQLFPAWDFGHPASWTRFLWFVRGELYKAYDSVTLGGAFSNLWGAVQLISASASAAGVALVAMGLYFTWKESRRRALRGALSLGLAVCPLALMSNFWESNPDVQGYLLPAFLLLAGIAAVGAARVYELLPSLRTKKIFLAACGIWIGFQAIHLGGDFSHRADWSAHRHMTSLLEELPPGAELSSSSFSTFSLTRYGQVAERRRPDAEIHYEGLPEFERGTGTRSSLPRTYLQELSIDRTPEGKYVLRNVSAADVGEIVRTGWFVSFSGLGDPKWLERRHQHLEGVLSELPPRSSESDISAKEPLLLNSLLHLMLARCQKDANLEGTLRLEIVRMFPGFDDFDSLGDRCP